MIHGWMNLRMSNYGYRELKCKVSWGFSTAQGSGATNPQVVQGSTEFTCHSSYTFNKFYQNKSVLLQCVFLCCELLLRQLQTVWNDVGVKGIHDASYTVFPSILNVLSQMRKVFINKHKSLVIDEYFKEKALKIYKSTFLSYK